MRDTTIHSDYIKAGSDLTSVSELKVLATSTFTAVRRRVAENVRTPLECLSKLAKDDSPEVRAAIAVNKSTPESILAQLANDESVDVRYILASTSYTSKHLLRQLAADPNPHVAKRAQVMLSALESKVGRMVTIFEFLSEDHGMLASQLHVLVERYTQSSHDKVFDQTVDALNGINRHLQRQRTLCLNWVEQHSQESDSILRTFEASVADQTEMMEQIFDLLVQHVDAPDFREGLGRLLALLRKHIDFAETELFTEMKKQVPPDELDAMNLRLNQALLRGESV